MNKPQNEQSQNKIVARRNVMKDWSREIKQRELEAKRRERVKYLRIRVWQNKNKESLK